MSRVGLNLLFINPKLSGGSVTYAKRLTAAIAFADKETEYYIYIHRGCEVSDFELGENFIVRVLPFTYSSVYMRYMWEQFVLPLYLIIDEVDLIHSLGYVTPLLTRKRKIVSILDINFRGHGANMKLTKRLLLGFMVRLSAHFSKRIITISHFSKNQITEHTHVKPNKIKVIYLSGSKDTLDQGELITPNVRQKYNLPDSYIIAFSSPSPHKNIVNLLLALKLLINEQPKLTLVLVGHQSSSNELLEIIRKENLIRNVIFTGFVPDEEVNPLIAGARVFVFPSKYEGFGIPILDAQKCMVPIASSNAGSLPEVGGVSVNYFEPEFPDDIARGIKMCFEQRQFSKSRIEEGLANRASFSWNKTALETLELYDSILKEITV